MPIDLAGWITFLVGAGISVLLEWSPAVGTWFKRLTGMQKRTVIAGLALLAALGAFAVSCGGVFAYVKCDTSGFYVSLGAAIQFFVGSQTMYTAMPKDVEAWLKREEEIGMIADADAGQFAEPTETGIIS